MLTLIPGLAEKPPGPGQRGRGWLFPPAQTPRAGTRLRLTGCWQRPDPQSAKSPLTSLTGWRRLEAAINRRTPHAAGAVQVRASAYKQAVKKGTDSSPSQQLCTGVEVWAEPFLVGKMER